MYIFSIPKDFKSLAYADCAAGGITKRRRCKKRASARRRPKSLKKARTLRKTAVFAKRKAQRRAVAVCRRGKAASEALGDTRRPVPPQQQALQLLPVSAAVSHAVRRALLTPRTCGKCKKLLPNCN